jgi:hypothetical protein
MPEGEEQNDSLLVPSCQHRRTRAGKAKPHKPTSLNAIRGALRESFSSRNGMLATTLVMESNYWSFTLQGGSTSGWA